MNRKLIYFLPVFLSLLSLINLLMASNSPRPSEVLAQRESTAESTTVASSPLPPKEQASPTPEPEFTGYCLNVPILMYHHVQPWSQAQEKWQTALTVDNNTFDTHMAYLKSAGYTTISSSQLAQALINHSSVPTKSIVITLDDGYLDAYTYALPILQKYQMHADFLIPTGLLNNPDYMTGDQLKAALATGLISTINHTYSHFNLGAGNTEKISFEVLTAKKQLAEFGKDSAIFGYPYGTVAATKFLQENGYIAGLSTIQGQIQCDSFLISLNRTRIGNLPLSSYGL